MTQRSNEGNKGVIVTGGSLSAENLAVGTNASVANFQQSVGNSSPEMEQLLAEVSKLVDQMERSGVDAQTVEAAKLAQRELESDAPNLVVAKSVLLQIADVFKNVGSFAGSIMSIKKLIGVLLP
jgi:hypothetical protein